MISCLCLTTASRSWCLPLAVQAFLRQTHEDAELLVVSDGPGMAPFVPPDPRVRHVHLDGNRSLGAKRNAAVRLAQGEVIVTWDDDDVHHPRRLETIAQRMAAGARVVGSTRMVFADLETGRRWLYRYQGERPYLVGGSLAFLRADWATAGGYREHGNEDAPLSWKLCALGKRSEIEDLSLYVATRHGRNTGACDGLPPRWTPFAGRLDESAEEGLERYTEAWRRR